MLRMVMLIIGLYCKFTLKLCFLLIKQSCWGSGQFDLFIDRYQILPCILLLWQRTVNLRFFYWQPADWNCGNLATLSLSGVFFRKNMPDWCNPTTTVLLKPQSSASESLTSFSNGSRTFYQIRKTRLLARQGLLDLICHACTVALLTQDW